MTQREQVARLIQEQMVQRAADFDIMLENVALVLIDSFLFVDLGLCVFLSVSSSFVSLL